MRRLKRNNFVLTTMAACVLAVCVTQRGFPPEHQIANFDMVERAVLYRGAQPNYLGLEWMRDAHGIKSVVNLRNDANPMELVECGQLGVTYTNLAMSGTIAPTKAHVDTILDIIESLPKPVYVHCQYGCDRTGLVVGCWRIRHGTLPADAVTEANRYGASAFLPFFKEFIRHYRR